MNMNKFFAFFLLLSSLAFGQQGGVFTPGDYNDGIYPRQNAIDRRYVPYTYLREADVTWERRVWRRIDMREKRNHALYFPTEYIVNRTSFLQALSKHILDGSILAFKDEQFTILIDPRDLKVKWEAQGDSTDQVLLDSLGNEVTTKVAGAKDTTWLLRNFTSIVMKEDWFFDRQKSSLEVRIIGLEIYAFKTGKEDLGEISQFFVYFPACRPVFAKYEVFNPKNDSERRTYEDIFWKRQFSSQIVKESNVFDRSIDSYSKGIDALLESDRVKQDIFLFEHDLWQF